MAWKFVVKNVHFVGIGGVGMSGIAEVMMNLGYHVTGSDIAESDTTRHLAEMGATIWLGHDASHVAGADAVVISSAVHEENPEVVEARAQHIPVVPRAVMLAELMRLRKGIAIAGTHGKTTTTSLTTTLITAGGLDPTFVIGGKLMQAGTNARLGTGEYLVAEADESDASFLNLSPVLSVITNIDQDHMDTYGHDFERLKQAFTMFIERLPFYGVAVLCYDDENTRSIIPQITKRVISYGLSEEAQVRAVDVEACGLQMKYTVLRPGYAPLPVVLNLTGVHNVVNSLAAITVATLVGVSDDAIQKGLLTFKGVGRRFAQYGDLPVPAENGGGTFRLVDDYGHHPHEMAATLAAARGAFPGHRIVVAFQPHRYTRTRDCFEDFVHLLSHEAQVVVLTEVYPAGEAPIFGAAGRSLARAIRIAGGADLIYEQRVDDVPAAILKVVRDGDVVITLGAGSIGHVASKVTELSKNEGDRA